MRSRRTTAWPSRFARVSSSACSLDQRTARNGLMKRGRRRSLDHPISPVVCRPEDRIVFAEGKKRARHVIRPQSRSVGPDDYNWAWSQPFDHPCHALSQIAFALRPNSDLPRPWSRAIRRDSEPRGPPRITAQPLQQRRKHHPLELPGCSPSSSGGEAALADAEARAARENDEVTG